MSRLTDEQKEFIADCKDKTRTACGSHNKRSHCGKSGGIKFPSDSLTEKQKRAMNGKVVTYNINEALTDDEFKKLPDDIKKLYVSRHGRRIKEA